MIDENVENTKVSVRIRLATIYSSEYGKIIFSCLICIVLFVYLWGKYGITFETNDDTGILGYVAGYRTGEPEEATIFCGILWGKIISSLYTITGSIPWYILVYMLLSVLSMSAFLKSLLVVFEYNKLPVYLPLILFLVIFLEVFAFYFIRMQFTVMSSFCGLGALSLLLTAKYSSISSKPYIGNMLWAIFLLIFAFSIRPKTGYIVFAVAIVSVIAFWIKDHRKYRIVIPLVILFFSAVISYGSTAIYESTEEWKDFREYHTERATYMDWIKPTYQEYPYAYESVGWSEDLAALVREWFFMDEHINADAFKTLNDAKAEDIRESFHQRASAAWQLLYLIATDGYCFSFLFALTVISCMGVLGFTFKRKWFAMLLEICILSSTIAGLWFLAFAFNRMLPRIFASVVFLSIVIAAILLADAINLPRLRIYKRKYLLVVIIFLIIPIFFVGGGYNQDISIVDREKMTIKKEVEEYAISNHSNIYIYDYSLSMEGDPFVTYSDIKPNNLIFWGGSGAYSPLYYDQIHSLGLQELYPEQFFLENVYFLGSEEIHPMLEQYMHERFPECSCVVTEQMDHFIVYKFIE